MGYHSCQSIFKLTGTLFVPNGKSLVRAYNNTAIGSIFKKNIDVSAQDALITTNDVPSIV